MNRERLLNKKYLMESPKEAERLKAKVDPAVFIEKYLKNHITTLLASKRRGASIKVLDLGCGAGIISATISKKYKKIEVYGVDLNKKRYESVGVKGIRNLKLFQANAYKLPFPDNHFDFVFTRFMLEYMKEPNGVIREMRRVLKPNKKILVQDLDGQLVSNFPVEKRFSHECNKVIKALMRSGFDPFIGRKIFYFFKKNKFKKVQIQMEPYHFFAGEIDKFNYSLWKAKLEIARPQIFKALGTERKADKFIAKYLAYLKNPNTFSFSNIVTVVGDK